MVAFRLALLALLWRATGITAQTPAASDDYGIDPHAKAGYFTISSSGNGYVFAINAVRETGDIYFHMSGPVSDSCWLGAGIGSEMKGALMLTAYPSADGKLVTISPRIATGHNEPTYQPQFKVLGVYNDTYAPNANTVTDDGTGTIIAHAVCLNCTTWATGALDMDSTAQPFIFAMGPRKDFRSDSPEASIPRHDFYGQYTMDMTSATNSTGWYGRVPAPNVPEFVFPPSDSAFASAGSTAAVDVTVDDDPMPGVHAALMCIAFVLVFPFGSLTLYFLKKVLWHAAVQVIGLIVVCAGFGVACYVSTLFNKSKQFRSGHQIFGLIILALLFVQLGLGLTHHAMYKKKKAPTVLGRIHFFLGPIIMIFGIINAGVGFDFAGNSHYNLPYGIIVAVVAIVVAALLGCTTYCKGRRNYKPEAQHPHFGPAGGSDNFEMSRAQTFGSQPPEPYEPTTPYSPTYPTPYTPVSAYTPMTPKAWRQEETANWVANPYNDTPTTDSPYSYKKYDL